MMDVLLARITQQAVHYAIRSGVSISAGFAFQQCHRLLKSTPMGEERERLTHLHAQLESKMRVVSPSVDMIELIAARGNTSLESVVSLAQDIRLHIQHLGSRLSRMTYPTVDGGYTYTKMHGRKSKGYHADDMRSIISQMEMLLHRINDAVPLINLAITTSGVSMSTKLSEKVSPGRLLQASTFVTAADRAYVLESSRRSQVGPTYVVSVYMLFGAHSSRPPDVRRSTWKEVIHKAQLKIWRVSLDQVYALPGEDARTTSNVTNGSIPAEVKAAEYAYQMSIVEDLDDNRLHTVDDADPMPGQFNDIANAGCRDVVPVHEISKIFFADTGKLLDIGTDEDVHNPVILLKRDVHAEPPRRLLAHSRSCDSLFSDLGLQDPEHDTEPEHSRRARSPRRGPQVKAEHDWRLPADLDPEWMAFEVYSDGDSASESSEVQHALISGDNSPPGSTSPEVSFKGPHLTEASCAAATAASSIDMRGSQYSPLYNLPPVKTTLSLLEIVLKLLSLQQFRQESHLAIEDELLNFFLETSSAAGSGLSNKHRQKLRDDALHRVGFDPYEQSPTKQEPQKHDIAPAKASFPETSASSDHFSTMTPQRSIEVQSKSSSPSNIIIGVSPETLVNATSSENGTL
jgi:hypothetical protein